MIVISDTTPIISLIKTGHLDLLQELFKEVAIPEAVYRELTANPSFREEADMVRYCPFIQIWPVKVSCSISYT